ncbi:MAG TPA: undecaprenyl-diphosphate phosphatase, partial [Pyrinomonadaceae bacterium]|nr:undecaprenyl-diphosphate phosphatase [Pyrinomonadaceae bacterium]
TEFIPVSSTAHLVFAARVVNLYGGADKTLQAEQTTATIAVIQLGTLLAVLVYFSRDIVNILRAFVGDHVAWLSGRSELKLSKDAWLGWLVIIGSIPVGIVGLLFKKQIEGPFTKNLWVIATMMIVVGLLLTIAEVVGKREHGMDRLGIKDAMAVGWAQVLALIPGSSRSGSTIMGGLFAGQTRETAARFSFLLSIPAIAASGLLELNEAIEKLPGNSYGALVVATIVSGAVGYASIWFLLRFLRTHSTGVFIIYRVIVGGLILIALSAGYMSASI